MKIYLDTSTIRKNSNNLNKFCNKDIFTSSLAIFELISGITENDFNIRQKVIRNLLNSSIRIDWETYKQKYYNAFQQILDDVERNVIKVMAEKIIVCKTFEEYREVRIYIDDDAYYTYESFENFDNDISNIGKFYSSIAKKEWSSFDKEDRRTLKQKLYKENILLPYIQRLYEFSLINLAENISGHKRPSDEYFNLIQKYNSNLEVHIKYMLLLFLMREINGSNCGKNDSMDLLHLVFLNEGDIIISEDKIFENLNNYMQLIKVYNSDEFIRIKNEE